MIFTLAKTKDNRIYSPELDHFLGCEDYEIESVDANLVRIDGSQTNKRVRYPFDHVQYLGEKETLERFYLAEIWVTLVGREIQELVVIFDQRSREPKIFERVDH